MPFVVPGQQQPQPEQRREGRGGGMERRDYASQQPGPAYRPPQQQQQPRGGGYSPWQQQRQMQYRQPQRQQYAPQGRGGYQQPQQRGYESYGRQPQRQQYTEPQQYSNRPQQGNYVGEGVYADGTPMPPMPSSGYSGQSLIQSNAGPAGGVYANFNATPDVIGGVTPRPYYEEEDTYNKPMRTGRGQGGIR